MKLVRVDIADFGRIHRAELELGEGLNVLYGPNDLGKSTVASAIRAALLLPHTSAHARKFIPWDRDAKPHVRLVFRADDGRYWRVTKTFSKGSGGSSLLETSNEGDTFTVEAKARQVDGELRKLLGWGIAGPGGKSAPRGLPESFLTHALLGDQEGAPDLLAKSVDTDSDEAGRERLTEALQALAQDPAFKRVLDAATRRVDEAFTATGKPSRARGAPFVIARDQVAEARKLRDTALEDLGAARAVLEEGATLIDQVARTARARDEARAKAEVVRRSFARGAHLRAARDRLTDARAVRKRFDEARAKLEEQRTRTRTLTEEADAHGKALGDAEKRAREAVDRVAQAEAAVREATADDAERDRALRMKDLERERDRAQRTLEQAETAAAAQRQRADAEKRLAACEAAQETAEEAERAAATMLEAAERELALLEHARDHLERRRAREQVRQMRTAADEAKELRKDVKTRRAAATRTENAIEEVPTPEDMERFDGLARELAVAEARLDVGVSLALRRQPGVQLDAEVDEEAVEVSGKAVDLEGERKIRLQIALATGEPLVEVVATGGSLEAKAAAARLRERWNEEVAPHLKQGSIDDLRTRIGAAETALRDVAERREEAKRIERRAVELEVRAAGLEEATQRLEGLEKRLADVDLDGLEIDDEASLHDRREQARERRERAQARREEALTKRRERASELAAAKRELEVAPTPVDGPTVEDARLALEPLENAIAALSAEREKAALGAEQELEQARAAREKANAALKSARAAREQTSGALREAEGRLAALTEQLTAFDEEALTESLKNAEGAMVELEREKIEEVSEGDLADAESALARAEEDVARAQKDLDRHEGRLEQVGGAVAEERYAAAEEAFELAERRQRDVETEYNAWKLLVETMRETENEEGQHLGEALAKPVSDALGRLLHQVGGDVERYGALTFGATLGTEGVAALGELRSTDTLSVGTREQIATLLRLTIAKHLHAPLVLDDHLTHSDPLRTEWFRDALREAAHDTQVLVITCHPGTYLDAEELASDDGPYRERAAGLLRAIDATQVIDS